VKRSRCKEEQIIGILKEQEAGEKTADVCRKPVFQMQPSTNTKLRMAAWMRRIREATNNHPKRIRNENATGQTGR
jgi:hypothetical protein